MYSSKVILFYWINIRNIIRRYRASSGTARKICLKSFLSFFRKPTGRWELVFLLHRASNWSVASWEYYTALPLVSFFYFASRKWKNDWPGKKGLRSAWFSIFSFIFPSYSEIIQPVDQTSIGASYYILRRVIAAVLYHIDTTWPVNSFLKVKLIFRDAKEN